MAFARWDPLGDLLALQQRLHRGAPGPADWIPAVDLHETDECYVVTAELPGLSRGDLHLRVDEGRLTLSGVRRRRESHSDHYHRIERGGGSFSRTFQLPLPIDADRITADLRDGVLTVTCPKLRDATARRIEIT